MNVFQSGVFKRNAKKLSIFHPSLLLGNRKEFRFGEMLGRTVAPVVSRLVPKSFEQYKPIESNVVAAAMVACATKAVSDDLHPASLRVYTFEKIIRLAALL